MDVNGVTVLLFCRDQRVVEMTGEVIRRITGLRLIVVSEPDEVLSRISSGLVGLVLIHQGETENSTEAARIVRGLIAGGRATPALVVSEIHRAQEALELLRLGAADYLSRPLDLNRLAYLVDMLTLRARYSPVPLAPSPETGPCLVREAADGEPFLYFASGLMGRQMEQVRRVAPQDATILLGGPTGTGKTRLARLIHSLSSRRNEPFLVVNCGALSATLIESEMFGHIKGAFTGADRDRTGKFAEVGRGTLLLDEIDSLPLTLQAKLLRAVEERIFEPVGSNKSLPMRARLIVASNRALDQEVSAGRFRADLYYRLNVVSFQLPPLRDRAGVVPHLVRSFAEEFSRQSGQPVPAILPEVIQALEAHTWPGNLRELRNVIERALALCDGQQIELADLPDALQPADPQVTPPPPAPLPVPTTPGTLSESKDLAELSQIRAALHRHGNNRLRAAAELGISRMTLYKKLHKYNLMPG